MDKRQMNYGLGHRSRQFMAAALAMTLCWVAVAPVWHHSKHSPEASSRHTHTEQPDIHFCFSGDHPSGPLGSCPICTSQRLLDHGLTQHDVEVSISTEGLCTDDRRSPADRNSELRPNQPRAPPAI